MNLTLCFVLAASLSSAPDEAPSSDDVAKAAKAYRQAQQAELGEEFALASDLYELADQLAPTAEALRGTVRTALAAQRWAVAADRALDLQRRYPDDAKSNELAEQTLERTRPLLDEVAVDCGGSECTVLVDGKTAGMEPRAKHVLFVEAGQHRLAGGFPGGTSKEVAIVAAPGGSSKVVFEPPKVAATEPTPPPPKATSRAPADDPSPRDGKRERSRRKISPAFFAVGAVATAGLAAGTAVSGVQALHAGDDFDQGGRTRELYDRANKLEIQTNVLFGVTLAVGVTTIVLAVVTDWKRGRDRDRRRAHLTPTSRGFALRF